MVPSDITVGKFVYEIRKHMKLSPEQAIFLFVNNTLPPTAALMQQIYEKYLISNNINSNNQKGTKTKMVSCTLLTVEKILSELYNVKLCKYVYCYDNIKPFIVYLY